MIIIGITGVIGSGKSTVSTMLGQHGFPVFDLDEMAKKVTASQEVLDEISITFGKEYVSSGAIDTDKIKDLVFGDKDALRKLENIIHPKVRKKLFLAIGQYAKNKEKAVIVDAPLLFETGMNEKMDRIVVVSTKMDILKDRLVKRGMSADDAARRLTFQIPLEEKERRADYVVKNNGSRTDLENEVAVLIAKIQSWEEEQCT